MGMLVDQILLEAQQGTDGAFACVDAARLLHSFFLLPTPQLAKAVRDGSLVGSLQQVAAYLPMSPTDREACAALCVQAAAPASEPSLEELRQDFTRLFAHPKQALVEPFESAFRSAAQGVDERPLIAVNRTALELDQLYARCGLRTPREATHAGDHIAVELAFFASALEQIAVGDADQNNRLVPELQAFMNDHADRWWKAFFGQVAQHAQTPTYAFVGRYGELVFLGRAV